MRTIYLAMGTEFNIEVPDNIDTEEEIWLYIEETYTTLIKDIACEYNKDLWRSLEVIEIGEVDDE